MLYGQKAAGWKGAVVVEPPTFGGTPEKVRLTARFIGQNGHRVSDRAQR
jgi:hypothetical protein